VTRARIFQRVAFTGLARILRTRASRRVLLAAPAHRYCVAAHIGTRAHFHL